MDSRNKSTTISKELVRELRQCYGLGASFFRAAAVRVDMTDVDMQAIDIMEQLGDATAGQIASVMGLTTGTFTAILNRLEKAGLVQRERDPNDGRRVIVRLVTGADGLQAMRPVFASLEKAWEDVAAHYDDEQKALLLAFLQRSNVLAREEVGRLREASVDDAGVFSAPLGNLETAQLVVHFEGTQLSLRAGALAGALYQARFVGPGPVVKVKDGIVTIRYPRRLWLPGAEKLTAEVIVSSAIPWKIVLKGGGALLNADLSGLDLQELEASGAGSVFRVDLPVPVRAVPIRLGGSGSELVVRRPRGVAARVQTQGWGSGVSFDDQAISAMSSDGWLQSPDYEGTTPRYDIEMSGSGSMITIAAG